MLFSQIVQWQCHCVNNTYEDNTLSSIVSLKEMFFIKNEIITF